MPAHYPSDSLQSRMPCDTWCRNLRRCRGTRLERYETVAVIVPFGVACGVTEEDAVKLVPHCGCELGVVQGARFPELFLIADQSAL